jgi:anti-anti-sigma factor
MGIDAGEPANVSGTLVLQLDHLPAAVCLVRVSGCLDRTTLPELSHVLDEELAAAPAAIVIDLSALSVITPDAVPALVRVAYRAGDADIGLCLVSADPTVNGALALAGVDDLFEIHQSVRAGLRSLN